MVGRRWQTLLLSGIPVLLHQRSLKIIHNPASDFFYLAPVQTLSINSGRQEIKYTTVGRRRLEFVVVAWSPKHVHLLSPIFTARQRPQFRHP